MSTGLESQPWTPPDLGSAHSPPLPLFLPMFLPRTEGGEGGRGGRLLLSRLAWPSDSVLHSQSPLQSSASCVLFIHPGWRRSLFWIPGWSSQPAPRLHHSTQSLQLQPKPTASVDRRAVVAAREGPLPRHGSGSEGNNLGFDGRGRPVASDQENQENGEFQHPSSLASNFTAQLAQ